MCIGLRSCAGLACLLIVPWKMLMRSTLIACLYCCTQTSAQRAHLKISVEEIIRLMICTGKKGVEVHLGCIHQLKKIFKICIQNRHWKKSAEAPRAERSKQLRAMLPTRTLAGMREGVHACSCTSSWRHPRAYERALGKRRGACYKFFVPARISVYRFTAGTFWSITCIHGSTMRSVTNYSLSMNASLVILRCTR